MKFRIIIGTLAILFFSFAKAQVSKTSFDKAVDLLNCKTVELTLTPDKIVKYQQDNPCGKTTSLEIRKFLMSVGKLEATIALSEEIERLKDLFKQNFKKSDATELLSEGVFNERVKYKKIFSFVERHRKEPSFVSYKDQLKADLTAILGEEILPNGDSTSKSKSSKDSLENRISILENEIKLVNREGWLAQYSDYLISMAILMSFIALVLSIVGFFFVKKSTKIFEKSKNDWGSNRISDYNGSLKTSDSVELKDIKRRLDSLEKIVKAIDNRSDSASFAVDVLPQSILSAPLEIVQTEVRTEIFYLASPGSDGSFDENSSSLTYKEGATIYRFTKTDNNKAKFQIDDRNASIKLALQYPDKRINPVCETENAFNAYSTRIITVKLGEAELQGNKWILNKKARIRYEN